MSQHLLFAVVAATTLVAACASQSSNRSSDKFHTQLDEDWTYWMTEYPETATAFGFPGQNMKWTDYSQSAIDKRAEYLKKSLQRLGGIDPAQLSADDRINYDLYRDLIDTAARGLDFHNDAMPVKGVIPRNLLMPINQLEGVQQDIPRTFAMMPAVTREDYENIVLRLERMGPLVDQTIALMEQGLAAGVTPPKITFRDVPVSR